MEAPETLLAAPDGVRAVPLWLKDLDGNWMRVALGPGSGAECPILQTAIDSVSTDNLDGLPEKWELEEAPGLAIRAMCLPCSHTFHVSALALAFCLGDMRCPVCRQGLDERLDIQCLPATVRADFGNRIQRVQAVPASPVNVDVTVDLGAVERDWVLLAHFEDRTPHNDSIAAALVPTHMQATNVIDPDSGMHEYRLQTYFGRHMRMFINRFKNNTHARAHFVLHHPHVEASISSQPIGIEALSNLLATGTVFGSGAPSAVELRADGLLLGSLRVSTDPPLWGPLPRIYAILNRDLLMQISLAGVHDNMHAHVQAVMSMVPWE